jgi:hypothetical protein
VDIFATSHTTSNLQPSRLRLLGTVAHRKRCLFTANAELLTNPLVKIFYLFSGYSQNRSRTREASWSAASPLPLFDADANNVAAEVTRRIHDFNFCYLLFAICYRPIGLIDPIRPIVPPLCKFVIGHPNPNGGY